MYLTLDYLMYHNFKIFQKDMSLPLSCHFKETQHHVWSMEKLFHIHTYVRYDVMGVPV